MGPIEAHRARMGPGMGHRTRRPRSELHSAGADACDAPSLGPCGPDAIRLGPMKVNDGYWLIRDGWRVLHPVDVLDVATTADSVIVTALTRRFTGRGAELNTPTLTVRLSSPAPGVIGVHAEQMRGVHPDHARGGRGQPHRERRGVELGAAAGEPPGQGGHRHGVRSGGDVEDVHRVQDAPAVTDEPVTVVDLHG